MRSLEDATMFAQRDGSTVELVVVLDSPDRATREWMEGYDFSYFDGYQKIIVANRSLGASRNDGIRIARGRFLATADGDDLVSFNMYASLLDAAGAGSDTDVFVPEYMFAFETEHFIKKFFGSEHLPPTALFGTNPYCSRICARTDLFRRFPYHPIKKEDGYAFEDWHFNCEVVANGCSIVPTPGTILFYRKRRSSITGRLEAPTQFVIPPSSYFRSDTFVRLCQRKSSNPSESPHETNNAALKSSVALTADMIELVAAANAIDPGITWKTLGVAPLLLTNLVDAAPAGAAYLRALKIIGDGQFTDVVLLDGVAVGGAERFIFNMVESLKILGRSRKALVLSSRRLENRTHRLPEGSTLIDLIDVCGTSDSEILDLVALRIIQATSAGATVHFKSSFFSRSFLQRFGHLLRDEFVVFYYFSDLVRVVNKARITDGYHFSTIALAGDCVDLIVSDHAKNIEELRNSLDCRPGMRIGTVYSKVDIPSTPKAGSRKPTGRLLWASRFSAEKRPELLVKIALRLAETRPDVSIDVYGVSQISTIQLQLAPQISYRGPYDSFSDLKPENYDGFIYTSAFDGMPNVVLEAMAHGLPVIAPDIGGISETVTEATGFLIEDDADDDVLVARYIAAIESLYDSEIDIGLKLQNAHTLLSERHSSEAHLRCVSELFDREAKLVGTRRAQAQVESMELAVGQFAAGEQQGELHHAGYAMNEPAAAIGTNDRQALPCGLAELPDGREARIRNIHREMKDQLTRTLYYARRASRGSGDQAEALNGQAFTRQQEHLKGSLTSTRNAEASPAEQIDEFKQKLHREFQEQRAQTLFYASKVDLELTDSTESINRKLHRELQEQRAQTLFYASKVSLNSAEQRDVSAARSLWRRIRARAGLPRMGSIRRGARAFVAIVFEGKE